MKLIIEKELAEKVANYLAQKPWIEVHELIRQLMSLQSIKEPTDDLAEKRDENSAS